MPRVEFFEKITQCSKLTTFGLLICFAWRLNSQFCDETLVKRSSNQPNCSFCCFHRVCIGARVSQQPQSYSVTDGETPFPERIEQGKH